MNTLSSIQAHDAPLPSYFFLTNKTKSNAALSPVDKPESVEIIENLFIVFKNFLYHCCIYFLVLKLYYSNYVISKLIHIQTLIYNPYLSEVISIVMSLNFLLNTSRYCSLLPFVTQVRLMPPQGFQRSLPPHTVLMYAEQQMERVLNWHMGGRTEWLTLYNAVLILVWLLLSSQRIYLVARIIVNGTVFLNFITFLFKTRGYNMQEQSTSMNNEW